MTKIGRKNENSNLRMIRKIVISGIIETHKDCTSKQHLTELISLFNKTCPALQLRYHHIRYQVLKRLEDANVIVSPETTTADEDDIPCDPPCWIHHQ